MSFSKANLSRLHAVMARHVDNADIPGCVAMISRHGETIVKVLGKQGFGASEPMRPDTIFRIASITKPIAAVAAMTLVEDCKLRLDDPVDKLLPELADRRVLKRLDGPLDETVPAKRAITLRDLLTFRAGIGMTFGGPRDLPIQRAARELAIGTFGPPEKVAFGPDEWLKRFATLPLMHQPGEAWRYNTAFAVLGILIERAAGKTLDVYLRERLFGPLGMKDTGFHVPATKLDRLAISYMPNMKTGVLEVDTSDGAWGKPPAFLDATGGLVSTVDDLHEFAEMLLGKGELRGQRLLSRHAVEVLTTNQITEEQAAGAGFPLQGWGFGVQVFTRRTSLWANPGRYGWDGGTGTSWANDPEEGLCGILLTQRGGFPAAQGFYQDFWTAAYAALDD